MDVVKGSLIPAVIDGGTWAGCFGLSWADMLLYDQAVGGRIVRPGGQWIRKVAGTMGVAEGRNDIVRQFMHSDAEWLFMVDSDMGFAPDTPSRLIEHAELYDFKVLGGLCFAQAVDKDLKPAPFNAQYFRIQPTIYRYVQLEKTGERGFKAVTKYRRDVVQKVGATGAACLLMHRDALEAVGTDPFSPITDPTAGGYGTSRTFSEDLSFCIRVQGAGLSVGVDTSVKTTHYKGGLYLDETTYAMQQETLIQAKGQAIAEQAELIMRGGV